MGVVYEVLWGSKNDNGIYFGIEDGGHDFLTKIVIIGVVFSVDFEGAENENGTHFVIRDGVHDYFKKIVVGIVFEVFGRRVVFEKLVL